MAGSGRDGRSNKTQCSNQLHAGGLTCTHGLQNANPPVRLGTTPTSSQPHSRKVTSRRVLPTAATQVHKPRQFSNLSNI